MTSPRALLTAHRLRPQRHLGQNFLSQPSVAERIVAQAGVSPEEVVLEIGAGLGALTIPLARAARGVIAIERDRNLVPLLRAELLAAGIRNVTIIETDALALDLPELAREAGRPLTVFGNLPYNISSQIVIKLIESRQQVSRAVLMFQKELAQRLSAGPGGRDYGRITAMLTYCASVRHLTAVNAHNFFPPPKVDSQVLEISFTAPRPYPPHDEAHLFRLIAAAFGKRRKTLKNALSASGLHLPPAAAAEALARAGIDPTRRAETLTAEEFVALEINLRYL
ncbi:MAG: ribosomal RNA small subunit methyltransferase A [Deltaproteobacteria bacterium]|nr:ribosomal RNA small subunit methyltransferase A [Deltaproteobacteria bacterium]